jgi:hypothetical protein
MASQETRQLEIFGQKLILETGGTEVDMPGVAAYMLESTTDDGVKYNQSHHEGGLSRIYAEKQLHVESGVLCNTTDIALIISAKKGDIAVNPENGDTRIGGSVITIEADNELVLQAPKIRIGYEGAGKTDKIDMIGDKINIDPQSKCTLAGKILFSNVFSAFAGTYANLASPFGAQANVAGKVFGGI